MPYKIIACSRDRYGEYFNQLNQWLEAFQRFISFGLDTGFIEWQNIEGKVDDLRLFFGEKSLSDCIYFQQLQGIAMGFIDPISDIIYKIDTFGARFDNDDDSIYPLVDCAFPAFNGCDKETTKALFLENLKDFKLQLVSVFNLKDTLFHTPDAVLTKDYSTMLSQYAWLGLDVIFVLLGVINDETVSHFCIDDLEPLKKEPKESLIALGLDELIKIDSLALPVYTPKEIALRRTVLLQQQTIIERTEAIEKNREHLRSQPLKDAKVLAKLLLNTIPVVLSSSPSLEVCEMYHEQIMNQLEIITATDADDPLVSQLHALADDIRATMGPLDALTLIDELAVPVPIGLPHAGMSGGATGGAGGKGGSRPAFLGEIKSRRTKEGTGEKGGPPAAFLGEIKSRRTEDGNVGKGGLQAALFEQIKSRPTKYGASARD